jgi:hypothetical protein
MSLIRIVDHFRNNPKRIDKLIAIKGLPDEWLYRDTPEGRELKKPWTADIPENIPMDIRHLCEPVYVNFRYSAITPGQKEVLDRRQILGLKIDYNTEPGREMWDQVERYVEETMPRNERVPVPVVCAKDEHSVFETYRPRRSATGSLEFVPAPIPEVDLTKYSVPVSSPVVVLPPSTIDVGSPPVPTSQESSTPTPQATHFKCDECNQEFVYQKAFKKHQKLHKKDTVPA